MYGNDFLITAQPIYLYQFISKPAKNIILQTPATLSVSHEN